MAVDRSCIVAFGAQYWRKALGAAAVRGFKELHIDIPGVRGRPVERMSGGQRQLVAIARAAFWGGKLLLLDEPTAALGVRESREVLDLIARAPSAQSRRGVVCDLAKVVALNEARQQDLNASRQ